jgi:hypothetical protein
VEAMSYIRSLHHEVTVWRSGHRPTGFDARLGHFINRIKLLIGIQISDVNTVYSAFVSTADTMQQMQAFCAMLGDNKRNTLNFIQN